MNNKTTKRAKNELTIEQKQEIIRYAEQNPHLKQVQIGWHFKKLWDFPIPPTTMSGILASKAKIMRIDGIENAHNKRIREARYPELEDSLYFWICEQTGHNVGLNDATVIEQAKQLGAMLGIDEQSFKYSEHWLDRFKARYSITRNWKVLCESASVSAAVSICTLSINMNILVFD